jgi:hypothetical protein
VTTREPRRFTFAGHEFVETEELCRATELTSVDHTLADGAIILRTSHQLRWFYVTAVKEGRTVRRRYRHDQMVPVLVTRPVPRAPGHRPPS